MTDAPLFCPYTTVPINQFGEFFMRRKENTKANFTQKRLTYFFILVVGTALLMNIYTTLFTCFHYFRYQSANRLIPAFRDYYQSIDLVMQNLNNYLVDEKVSDYESAIDNLNDSMEYLGSLALSINDSEITREILDLSHMTEILREQMVSVNEAMNLYHEEEKEAFHVATEKFQEVQGIYTAIQDEYDRFSEMLFEYTEEVYLKMNHKYFVSILIFLVIFFVSAILMFRQVKYIHDSISGPVNQLIHAAEQVQLGHFDEAKITLKDHSIDEGMMLLIQVFNKMTDQVKLQIETLKENVRVQKELQESRFKELQMQINPHFMFNTLNMISDFAYLENAEKTIVLLNKTAKMFRFSLDFSGKTVTLSKEIEELGNYLYIQQQRFGKRIHFVLDLDENCPDLKIPALILQPLVENAITHGVGMLTSNAQISIRSVNDAGSDTCHLIIQDNGEGMSESKRAQVENEMRAYTMQNAKIGLGNVYLRLKMFFGDKVSMNLESSPGQGTKITISINYAKEETRCIE